MEKVDLEIKKTILSVTVKDNEGNPEHIKLPGTGVDVISTTEVKIPIIPSDFEYVKGTWNSGFVIQDKSGNQFVWVPTSDLIGNGIIDGHKFSKSFGKRNFEDKAVMYKFIEHLTPELKAQVESVEKYGGFYVSRYMMSRFEDSPKSFEGFMPWTSIKFDEAVLQAEKMARAENWDNGIAAHVIYAAEYDSIMQWIIESRVKSYDEIVNDSTNIGNYCNNTECINRMEVTGNPNFEILNISDLAGNIWTWTREQYKDKHGYLKKVIRGGSFEEEGYYSANFRKCTQYDTMFVLGFRTALYIK